MGKVFKAVTKASKERPQSSFAAFGSGEAEARPSANANPQLDGFDFVNYSLNTPPAAELERVQNEIAINERTREVHLSPATEVTLNSKYIDPHLVGFYDFEPRATDQYDRLAIALILGAAERPLKRVLVASAARGEGRTSVVLNLACALSRSKKRVLIVDADLHRPSVLRLLGVETQTGLGEALERKLPAGAATVKVLPFEFAVLSAREPVENSVQILAASSFKEMLQELDYYYDFILFDSPPLLATGDSRILLRSTDATLMVIRAGKISSTQMSKAIAPLTEENIFGVVLNRVGR